MASGHSSAFPVPIACDLTGPEKSSRGNARHSKLSTNVLQRWFDANIQHPYPSEDEKATLQHKSGLNARQLNHWFANARRRRHTKRPSSVDGTKQAPLTSPIPVPGFGTGLLDDQQSPLERWRNSPPEEEPADLEAIAAATNFSAAQRLSSSEPCRQSVNTSGDGGGLPGPPRAPSTISGVTWSDRASLSSWQTSSADSSSSSQAIAGVGMAISTTQRRRARRSQQGKGSRKRSYQCTFCTDTFLSRYDWSRHEAALHLNLEQWTCMLFGPTGFDTDSKNPQCCFCAEPCPTEAHLDSHHINSCRSSPAAERTYLRKDHLRQHVRLVHGVPDIQPLMSTWHRKVDLIRSRCGFCAERFTQWSQRNEHLAAHFKAGATMKEWKGDRGLEPSVAFHVQNAMPPYLIATEADEFEPFSASRTSTTNQSTSNNTRDPTVFEALTLQLSEYVRAALRRGELVNDETARKQARLLMYGDNDAWNQTPADNAEWLRLFKDGLNLNAPAVDACPNPYGPGPSSCVYGGPSDPATSVQTDGGPCFDFLELSMGSQAQLPLAWQTPECLAEFRQMAQQQPLSHPRSGSMSSVCDQIVAESIASFARPMNGFLHTSGRAARDYMSFTGSPQDAEPRDA